LALIGIAISKSILESRIVRNSLVIFVTLSADNYTWGDYVLLEELRL